MRIKIKFLILFFIPSYILYPQQDLSQSQEDKKAQRFIFLYSNLGSLDFLSLGVGYQVTENLALSIKGSQTFIGGASYIVPNFGAGLGFKINYFTSFLFFNSISLEYITYLDVTIDENYPSDFFKGNYYDLNIGHEDIYDEGFNFYWAIGLCVSQVKTLNTLYAPSIKIGFNYNFK